MNLVLGIAMLLLATICVVTWATCIRRPLLHPALPLTRPVLASGYSLTSLALMVVVLCIVGPTDIRVTVAVLSRNVTLSSCPYRLLMCGIPCCVGR